MEYPSELYKLVDDLKERKIIKTKEVAAVMKNTDRADFVKLLPY